MSLPKDNKEASKQQLLLEILIGLKEKFFLPLINENKKLAAAVNKKGEKDDQALAELMERVARLERKIEDNPVTILSAIRDAINQVNGGKDHGPKQPV